MVNIDSMVRKLRSVTLDEEIDSDFKLDDDLIVDSYRNVTEVKLHFYQVWLMFDGFPCVVDTETDRRYEYKIFDGAGNKFVLNAWRGEKSFLKVTRWNVGTTATEETAVKRFLEHLLKAVACYNNYYRQVEMKMFSSDDPEVNEFLKTVRQDLVKHRGVLKAL